MKNINVILLTAILGVSIFSCTPQTNTPDSFPVSIDEEECCGDDSPIPPPPPTED
ncbi:hypothetical protein SAMN04489722_101387 [Algibacter lectus]|uniref:hypothetical protein n=1 Tax=Algibacter lectus TaxID=221126 RepID=UPI0008F384D0|nr:hypothetical protein [Algibacter lectus]SFB97930.1 hypothetical protein SAMN04489722_101387 [Algibacter lectus]